MFSHGLATEAFRHPALTAERSRADKHPGRKPRGRSIDMEGRTHKVVRGSLTKSFYPMVARFAPRVEELVASMTDVLEASIDRTLDERSAGAREVDFVEHFAYPLPINAIADLLGVPDRDRTQFQQWSHDLARSMDRFYSKGAFNFAAMHGYFADLVAERVAHPGDDLISRLLEIDEFGDERLTPREIVELAVQVIFAGHETTVNLLGNGLLALLADDRERRRFAADPGGLAEEGGRGVPPLRQPGPADRPGGARAMRVGREGAVAGGRARGRDRLRQPRRGRLRRHRRSARHGPQPEPAHRLRPRTALLPRLTARPARGPHRLPPAPRALPRPAPRRRAAHPPTDSRVPRTRAPSGRARLSHPGAAPPDPIAFRQLPGGRPRNGYGGHPCSAINPHALSPA